MAGYKIYSKILSFSLSRNHVEKVPFNISLRYFRVLYEVIILLPFPLLISSLVELELYESTNFSLSRACAAAACLEQRGVTCITWSGVSRYSGGRPLKI